MKSYPSEFYATSKYWVSPKISPPKKEDSQLDIFHSLSDPPNCFLQCDLYNLLKEIK